MLYFAYGSCMSSNDLARTTSNAVDKGLALLEDYNLVFDVYAKSRGCGAANVRSVPQAQTLGRLWEVDSYSSLDAREGHPYVYKRTEIKVYSYELDKMVDCVTYIALSGPDEEPSAHYRGLLEIGLEECYSLSPDNISRDQLDTYLSSRKIKI